MKPHPAVLALGEALQQQIRETKTSARAVSVALGWNPHFLSHALRGHRPLRVEVVFQLLARLKIVPFELFTLVFPFGGERLHRRNPERVGVLDISDIPTLVDTIREGLKKRGALSPAEYRLRLGELVQREIRRRRLSTAEVSRRLGLGSTALGQALRGKTQLTFFHVLAALDAIEVHPGRVFLSLFLPDVEDPVLRAAQDEALLALEGKSPEAVAGFMLRRERKAREKAEVVVPPQPSEGEPSNEEPRGGEPSST